MRVKKKPTHRSFHGTIFRASYVYYQDHARKIASIIYGGQAYHSSSLENSFHHFPDFNMLEGLLSGPLIATHVHLHDWVDPDPPSVRPILKINRCFVPLLNPLKPPTLGFVQIRSGPIGYYRLTGRTLTPAAEKPKSSA